MLQSRREEVDDQVIEYIEASSRAQQEREEKERQAERALIEAAEAAKRERLEREAERLRARPSAESCGRGGDPARATHALCGHRRDGVGSHGRRRRIRRVQRQQSRRKLQAQTRRGRPRRRRLRRATRRSATSLFRFRFFRSKPRRAATPRPRSCWRWRRCPKSGLRPRGHISLKRRPHFQGSVGAPPNSGLPTRRRSDTCSVQSDRRSHRHCVLR